MVTQAYHPLDFLGPKTIEFDRGDVVEIVAW